MFGLDTTQNCIIRVGNIFITKTNDDAVVKMNFITPMFKKKYSPTLSLCVLVA